jgi:hypothetical protein
VFTLCRVLCFWETVAAVGPSSCNMVDSVAGVVIRVHLRRSAVRVDIIHAGADRSPSNQNSMDRVQHVVSYTPAWPRQSTPLRLQSDERSVASMSAKSPARGLPFTRARHVVLLTRAYLVGTRLSHRQYMLHAEPAPNSMLLNRERYSHEAGRSAFDGHSG